MLQKPIQHEVGEGPFPTEEFGETNDYLRTKGCEFGTTTSRPRRCGWLDLVVLRYAVRVNGITEICLTKLDVLDDLKTIKVCTAYQTPSGKVEEFPLDLETFSESQPIYDELPGWECDISQMTNFDDLPLNTKNYVVYFKHNGRTYIVGFGWFKAQANHSFIRALNRVNYFSLFFNLIGIRLPFRKFNFCTKNTVSFTDVSRPISIT